jgi:hypothetical protein
VIGVGVKNSTSDLLVANCDEFIFYDDLVRELAREPSRGAAKRDGAAGSKRPAGDERQPKADSEERKSEERKSKAIALAVETLDALVLERGDSGKIWASVLKSAIKRRRPDFNETRYGFRAFGNLLDEAQARGFLEVGRDEKSGAFVSRTSQPAPAAAEAPVTSAQAGETPAPRSEEPRGRGKGRGKGRRGGREAVTQASVAEAHGHVETDSTDAGQSALPFIDAPTAAAPVESVAPVESEAASAAHVAGQTESVAETATAPRRARKTAPRKSAARKKPVAQPAGEAPSPEAAVEAPPAAAKKTAPRTRRARAKVAADES